MTLDALISAPLSTASGAALMQWMEDLRGRILRGDMMLGILSLQEVERAPQAMERAIECGIEKAWLALADWWSNPPFGEPDPEAAITTLRSAMAANIAGAALRLSETQWFYRREEASPEEQAEAYTLAKNAADAEPGNSRALHQLGLLTCQGFGTDADPARAAALQGQAAALGHPAAMFEAYIHHETGLGVPKDSARAFAYLEQAANAGHPRALYNMGAAYATGRGVAKDMARAAQWYEQAADAGNPRAMATLAAMYATGDGVEQDLDYASQLFDEADYLGFDVATIRASLGLED